MAGGSQDKNAVRKGPWGFTIDYPSRWLDNDQYGHLNNSSYYLLADSIINSYLARHCGIQAYIDPSPSPSTSAAPEYLDKTSSKSVIGLIISSDATYFASTSFPSTLRVGMRVVKLGNSSVGYEIGIWQIEDGAKSAGTTSASDGVAAVVTHATHVFVDRTTRRPVKKMPKQLRDGLERLLVKPDSKL